MSTTKSKAVPFFCIHDHSQLEACPGHTLQIMYHNTSDTVSVLVDGLGVWTTEDGYWNALLEAIKQGEQ